MIIKYDSALKPMAVNPTFRNVTFRTNLSSALTAERKWHLPQPVLCGIRPIVTANFKSKGSTNIVNLCVDVIPIMCLPSIRPRLIQLYLAPLWTVVEWAMLSYVLTWFAICDRENEQRSKNKGPLGSRGMKRLVNCYEGL